ncbi:hypothetical protein ABPG77_003402 [Micractinium sp. CCAP 211/92]
MAQKTGRAFWPPQWWRGALYRRRQLVHSSPPFKAQTAAGWSSVISPIILPFASLYFLLTWPVWRYQLLYVYQGHFTVMAVKGGCVAALILFFTSVAFLN